MRIQPRVWLLVVGAFVFAACGSDGGKPKDAADAPARRKLLEHLTTQVLVPSYENFASEARTLENKTASYAKSLSEADRDAARAAFDSAMIAWERVEVLQIGPLGVPSSRNPPGKGLRNEVYRWPSLNRCGIDQALVTQSYTDPTKLAKSTLPNARGLLAIEILLFDSWTETSCAAGDKIVTPAAWQKLVSSPDFEKRRAAYASAIASYVKKQADAIVSAFKNGFSRELATAGAGSDTYETTQDALNAVSDALFYVDTETKDMKIAVPAAIAMSCEKPCPERVEHPYAKISKEAVLANLEAFRDVFRGLPPGGKKGTDMWGFADLLRSVSASKVASDMDTLIDKSIAAVKAIDGPLEEAVADPVQEARVMDAYAQIQDLMTRLKSDFIIALSLSAPMSAAGDND